MIAIGYSYFISGVLTTLALVYASEGNWGIALWDVLLVATTLGCAIYLSITERRRTKDI